MVRGGVVAILPDVQSGKIEEELVSIVRREPKVCPFLSYARTQGCADRILDVVLQSFVPWLSVRRGHS